MSGDRKIIGTWTNIQTGYGYSFINTFAQIAQLHIMYNRIAL